MRKVLFAAALSVAVTACVHNDAHAFGRRSEAATAPACTAATAAEKSQEQARRGVMAHLGRLRAGCFEGVGFSTRSAAEALSSCCYSNSGLPVLEESVVRGRSGWFATRIYAATKTTCANGNCK